MRKILIGTAVVGIIGSLGVGMVAFAQNNCDPAYAGVCIAPPPPDLDCGQIPFRQFRVYRSTDPDRPAHLTRFDPHGFDGDNDGVGCEPPPPQP